MQVKLFQNILKKIDLLKRRHDEALIFIYKKFNFVLFGIPTQGTALIKACIEVCLQKQ